MRRTQVLCHRPPPVFGVDAINDRVNGTGCRHTVVEGSDELVGEFEESVAAPVWFVGEGAGDDGIGDHVNGGRECAEEGRVR